MHIELIDKIINEGDHEAMQCLRWMLIDLIDDLKYTDHDRYKKLEYKLYKTVYGNHLNEKLAKDWVSHMENKDGTKGEHWSLEQTNQFVGKHNKYDFYAALNMVYSDYYNPRFDTNAYVELANDWLEDEDIDEGKTLKYYMLIARE